MMKPRLCGQVPTEIFKANLLGFGSHSMFESSRGGVSKINSLILQGVVLGCLLIPLHTGCCCHYPKSNVTRLTGSRAQAPTITLVAYGDTRTGPWGLGDNAHQFIHGKVVDDIFKSNGSIDAVLFTGDAVMTNFPLWKKCYWKCFLSQTNRFRDKRIPFYPSLGNHEVLPEIVPLFKTANPVATGFTAPQVVTQREQQNAVAKAYEAGEEPKTSPDQLKAAEEPGQPIDVYSKQGRAQLKRWERGIAKKKDTESANKFGQFERQQQTAYYRMPSASRCGDDAKIFSDDYLTLATYQYLRPVLNGRSYYSLSLEKNGVRVKVIALDTNCLDSELQQKFFVDELKTFDGPIIVFGHHPPVDYDLSSPWPWDMVPGWKFFREYLSNADGKKILLWIFGHVHDYQRRDSTGGSDQPTAPVLLIAGGGGASLDPTAASFQWQPASWPQPLQVSAFHHIKISVMAGSIEVEIRGAANGADGFRRIDSFSIPLGKNISN